MAFVKRHRMAVFLVLASALRHRAIAEWEELR
jgi:hypothetical protein